MRNPIEATDVVWAFSGVRSLYGEHGGAPQDVTRDYHLDLDAESGAAPLLTVYGGKITTYRRLAEAALAALGRYFPPQPPWTANAPLPGGDFPHAQFEELVVRARSDWPFLAAGQASRLVSAYGRRLQRVLGAAEAPEDLAPWFGPDLSGAEVRWLMAEEWAETGDDVLWRRSKLGLLLDAEQREALTRFMRNAGRCDETAKVAR
jgi:glycerol-3-phosphate dehydrogenase